MSRREECDNCKADQHVCKMCVYFVSQRCQEERAEHISVTEKANFCDYFKPSNKSTSNLDKQKSAQAKADLAALFGDELPEATQQDESLSPSELADKKLRDMLNGL
ncbi:hypothetical protein [Paraglaciecola arctica]|uniref:hypothetical protein n=1 Tax=Paraglaciecola arctica TaxID=1128911 RepID=UPI002091DB34|nr:hypothetical protein [Paraglaciecola arctica]